MFAVIGACIFLVIMVMTLLVACGLPLGEFTMGGQHKVLSKQFRIMERSVMKNKISWYHIIDCLNSASQGVSENSSS